MFSLRYLQASVDFLQGIAGKPEDRAAGLRLAVGRFHDLILSNMNTAMVKGKLYDRVD